jgi:hypothetical protein
VLCCNKAIINYLNEIAGKAPLHSREYLRN